LTPGVALFLVVFAFNLLGDQLLRKSNERVKG
jgi:ABC-type dipeptide/oligopeptide/nickel transport system permease subunit